MKEYEAEVEVTVTSNKNENKYKIKQHYKKDSVSTQEILEPDNLKGVKITTENNKITLENTDLNLTKIFEGYNGIEQNDMDLHKFINDFEKNISKSNIYQNDEQIVIKTISENNKYSKNKTLYINRKTGKPSIMEIKDINKKTTVYIVYNKVEMQ